MEPILLPKLFSQAIDAGLVLITTRQYFLMLWRGCELLNFGQVHLLCLARKLVEGEPRRGHRRRFICGRGETFEDAGLGVGAREDELEAGCAEVAF